MHGRGGERAWVVCRVDWGVRQQPPRPSIGGGGRACPLIRGSASRTNDQDRSIAGATASPNVTNLSAAGNFVTFRAIVARTIDHVAINPSSMAAATASRVAVRRQIQPGSRRRRPPPSDRLNPATTPLLPWTMSSEAALSRPARRPAAGARSIADRARRRSGRLEAVGAAARGGTGITLGAQAVGGPPAGAI